MALIPCRECGKEISDKAPACPNCGVPNEHLMQVQNIPSSAPSAPAPAVSRTTGSARRECPQCTTPMNVKRRVIVSVLLMCIGLAFGGIGGLMTFKFISMLQAGNALKWEIAGPIMATPFLGIYLIHRGNKYFSPHLICPKCRKELWN